MKSIVKCLFTSMSKLAKYLCEHFSDLAVEAEFLSALSHPNIIKLRGVSQGGAECFGNGPGGYFLIIDRLFETLDERIKNWKEADSSAKNTGGHSNSLNSRRGTVRGRMSSLLIRKTMMAKSLHEQVGIDSMQVNGWNKDMDERLSVGK